MCLSRIQKVLVYGWLLLAFSFVEQSTVLCQLKDLFPLGKGVATYSYFSSRGYSYYSPGTHDSFSTFDSKLGTVAYTVLGFTVINDSIIHWRVRQVDIATVRNYYSTSGSTYDVTKVVKSDSSFILIEKTRDFHELFASMLIWNFKKMQRFSSNDLRQVQVMNTDINFDFVLTFPINFLFKADSGLVSVEGSTQGGGFSQYAAKLQIRLLNFDLHVPNQTFELYQNYPNPFNLTTTIEFDLLHDQFVSLNAFDVLGRHVSTIYEGERKTGNYKMAWTPQNLPSGVYFYRMQTAQQTYTQKMILLK